MHDYHPYLGTWVFGHSGPPGVISHPEKSPKFGFEIVVGEFRRRREALNKLAIRVLSGKEQDALGISDSKLLDERAGDVYRAVAS